MISIIKYSTLKSENMSSDPKGFTSFTLHLNVIIIEARVKITPKKSLEVYTAAVFRWGIIEIG